MIYGFEMLKEFVVIITRVIAAPEGLGMVINLVILLGDLNIFY